MKMLNKILGCGAAAAFIVIGASTTHAQNILINPSFEDAGGFTPNPITPTSGPGATPGVNQGWALYNNVTQTDMSSSPDSPLDGNYSLLIVNNTWNGAGAYQLIAPVGGISAGDLYTFNISQLTDTGFANYTTPLSIQVQFLGAWNGTSYPALTPGSQSANNGNFVNPQPPINTWQQLTTWATAPAGAAEVLIRAQTIDGNAGAAIENMYIDAGSLVVTPAPEPTTLALMGLGGVSLLSLIRRRKA